MKRKVNIWIHSMILIFILALFVGNSAVRAEEEVKINYPKYTVNIGDEDDVLQLEMLNQKEGDKKPRWISYNVNVARVDQNGVVTPLRKGKTIISSGIGFPRKVCVVTVVDPSVKLNKTAVTLYRSDNTTTPGNTIALTAKVNGATKKATDVVWSSSDISVAKVDPDPKTGKCKVTSVAGENGKAGTAVITARVNGRTASCKVTVLDSTISLNVNEMQLSTKGVGSSIKLVPTVVGSNKKKITWTSDNTKVATVSGGKVTGKAEGNAIVTAKANGVETTCTVTVVPGLISINEEKVLLYVTSNASDETTGETKELKTNAANNAVVEWSSSNEEVVKVEGKAKGKATITAVGTGTAVITAKCSDKTDTCVVEVKNTVTSIAEDDVHLKTKGESKTYTLNYNVVGRKNAVWKSSNTKVVSVSKGKITAKKAGNATVTVKANGVEDEVRVFVTNYTPTIALNQKEYTLYTKGTGNTVTLKATIDGTSKKAVWYSNNSKVAEVNAKGKVTAKGEGSALITATANGVTAKCWVNVKEPRIILEKNALVIKVGDRNKHNLCDYTSMEIIGAKQSVTYKSSHTNVATVDKKGNVIGKSAGETTITIKANGVEETCEVIVSKCETHDWVDMKDTDEKYKKYNKPATCEESGLSSRECKECHAKEQKVTPPLGHSFGKWTVVAKATENAAGLEKQVCTRCNTENTRTIPAKNKDELAYGYNLVWEDDFNGDKLDEGSWNVEEHDPGWVNNEWQEYVKSTDNIYVEDGHLVIQAIKSQAKDAAGNPKVDEDGNPVYEYTSGRINTQGNQDYTYGKFEVRAKVPSGKGFLPAFWMMPTEEGYYGQWPKCGEIDVMEVMGQETNKAYSTLHFGEPHTQKQGTYTLSKGDFSNDFHVYACEWDPGEFRFYVDGNLFYTENDWFTQKPGFGKAAYPAPYDQPFYMILNLAVGGEWVGYPDENTEFGDNAQLVVDYVRVYQKDADAYNTDIERPDKVVQLRDPDGSGNYIINGDFKKAEKLPNGENWKLLLTEEGEATAEIKEEKLHITTTNAGKVNYSVQIVQADLPLEKDCKYTLSYDAYADEARTMVTNVTAPDRGYIRYLADTMVDLSTETKHFEHTFDMKSDSDANGRVEFNLGNQGSTATVHITNVRLEKAGAAAEDVKDVLPDGNYVYNGSFDEGDEAGRLRLAYWDWDIDKCEGANVSVTRDPKRELKVVVPETVKALDDVVVYQESIAIKGGKTYALSFDAYADQEKTIKATIAGETFESALTTEKKEYRYELNTAAELNGSELRFLLGAAGTTYIDNVSVREAGMIINGDFSSGMTGYEVFVDSSASVSSYIVDSLNEKDAFSIDIVDTGDADWKIQLKQNNIKLEKDKWYKIGFDAKSTMDREIMYALQRDGSSDNDWTPYSGTQHINLTGTYQNFSHTFKMANDTDPRTILSISMGAVGGTQIQTKHTVVIDNITLEETDPVDIPPVEEGTEMIKNGDFSEGDAHWDNAVTAPGAAEVSFEDGKAVYNITNVGTEDYHIQLKHKEMLTLEKGAEYAVKFKIKSTEARIVKYAFLNPAFDWYGGEDLSLTSGDVKEVEYTLKVDKDTNDKISFVISMGQIYDNWDPKDRNPVPTPVSTIEIDDISVKKIGGTGEEDPIKPVAPGTDLIKNGDFSKGKEDWTESGIYEAGKGTESFEDGKAVYEITNVGTEDWHIQLKQTDLTLEKDATYKLSFKVKSTAARNVMYKLQDPDNGYADYGSKTINLEADTEKTVEEEITVDKATSKSIIFVIAMGKTGDETIPTHTIEIDDVHLVKEDGAGNDPSDDPAIEIGAELIKNGKFEQGKTDWSDYVHKDGGAEATSAFTDNKARYEITKAGEEDWNVQLKQEGLTMEKDATYKVNFKIGASIDRDVRLAFMGAGNAWCGGSDISLTKNKLKSFSQIVTLNDKYTSGTVAFQLSMGQLDDTTLASHAIEISDVSVTKVEAGTEADEVTEEEVTITPPEGSGETPEDPEDPVEENLIKNGDFSNGETSWQSSITTPGTGTKSIKDGKAVFNITNVGEQDWHVQLKQGGITLEQGADYKVSFKIKSTVSRTVKSVLMTDTYDWYGGEDAITLKANEETQATYGVKVGEKETSDKIEFVISMGKIGDEEISDAHTIEITDIRLIKVKDGTATEEKNDADAKTTLPANNSVDDASDDPGDATEVQDDQDTDDKDGISDNTADDEDADSAENDTSDTQNDSKDAETSDGDDA